MTSSIVSKVFLLAFFVLLGINNLQAQSVSTDTLSWTAATATNQAGGSTFNHPCVFITYGAKALDWSQADGDVVFHFDVIGVDGQWPDITADGQIIFNLQNGGITGSLELSRSRGNTNAHLKLWARGRVDQDYIFSITSISRTH